MLMFSHVCSSQIYDFFNGSKLNTNVRMFMNQFHVLNDLIHNIICFNIFSSEKTEINYTMLKIFKNL